MMQDHYELTQEHDVFCLCCLLLSWSLLTLSKPSYNSSFSWWRT